MAQPTILLITIVTLIILKSNIISAQFPNIFNLGLQSDIISANFPNIFNLNSLFNNTRPDFLSLAAENGYPATKHEVITEDGYILTLFHIPGRSRFPVFLLHGILDSADTWLVRGDKSLGVALADQGYDLWFGNSRGNRYSRRHTSFNADEDNEFWEFSFNEVGHYDLPALIDRVLMETGAPTLSAIAHSQGTTSFYVLGATRPEYNEKVNVMTSLAPVCYFRYSIPPLATIFKMAPLVVKFVNELNLHEYLGDSSLPSHIYRLFCPTPVIGYTICVYSLIFPFTGYDAPEFEPGFFPTFVKHFPAGTSTRSLMHYLQVGHTNSFAHYDNGPEGNLVRYNSTIPPLYDLGKVKMPIALIAGRNDYLSMVEDVITLKQQLPNVVYYVVSPRVQFNHLDDIWGRRMRIYLFPFIFEVLQKYNGFKTD